MQILHLTQKDYKTSQWSGGTTTELLIWPEGADYAKREFQVRISSATVELVESDFTPLQGVIRYITPLSGGFTLTHPGEMPVVMAPMAAPYRFSGETPTHCVGTATDFNLMLKGVEGCMQLSCETWLMQPGLNGFYATEQTRIQLDTEHCLAAGDFLVVFAEENAQAKVCGKGLLCYANV